MDKSRARETRDYARNAEADGNTADGRYEAKKAVESAARMTAPQQKKPKKKAKKKANGMQVEIQSARNAFREGKISRASMYSIQEEEKAMHKDSIVNARNSKMINLNSPMKMCNSSSGTSFMSKKR